MPTPTGAAIALVPLSDPSRDITIMTASAARVALRQLAPKPYSIERVETLATLERFLKGAGDAEIAWLTDGVDTGRGVEFVEALGKTIGDRSLTIFEGGTPSPLALAAAENAAAKMTVKVLRTDNSVAAGIVRGLDAKGSPIGEARFAFAPGTRETEAAFDLPVELRNDISRLEISGERSAGAVQLLDKRWRRRAIGIVTGSTSDTAQPLLALDLLSHPRAGAVRRRAARRQGRAAAGADAIPRPEAADDRDGRCRHADAGNPRPPRGLDRPGRRAGALCRPAAGARRRRSRAGAAAPRRPHARRQPDLGEAAASRRVRRRRSVRGPRPCRRTSP